jgi:hypothetical protein
MKILAGLLLTMLLTMTVGCAQTDWIDRTLVTVDVTGSWVGRAGAGSAFSEIWFELEQQGSTVKGFLRVPSGAGFLGNPSGSLEGTVSGDVFRFRNWRGSVEGELTVSGDEMNGLVSLVGQRALTLRRVDPSSLPASPPR